MRKSDRPAPSTGRRAALAHGARRLAGGWAALLVTGLGVAGCASPAPPLRRLRLPLEPAGDGAGEAAPARAGDAADPPRPAAVWELDPRVPMPAYLDRDAVLFDAGGGTVETLPGHRWAEPLRDAVPRLLLHDLQRLRGLDRVWLAPAPDGRATHRVAVELLALAADAPARQVVLRLRWTRRSLAPAPAGAAADVAVGTLDVTAPLPALDGPSLVRAHREALWQAARQLAAR